MHQGAGSDPEREPDMKQQRAAGEGAVREAQGHSGMELGAHGRGRLGAEEQEQSRGDEGERRDEGG